MTKAQAERACDPIRERINEHAGEPRRGPVTLKVYVESVYFQHKRKTTWKKGSTAPNSLSDIRKHILEEMGERPIRELSRSDLQALLDRKAEAGCSETVVKHIRWHLSGIFKLALADGVVSVNSAAALDTPRNCRRPDPKRIPTAAEVQEIGRGLEFPGRLFFRLAAVEGMRPGEFFGLQMADVTGAGLVVRRRAYRLDIDTPKTRKSARLVALSADTRILLEKWMEMQPDKRPEAWVFQSENPKTPMDRCNVLERWLKPALKKLGFAWIDFRVLRRAQATLSKENGIDAKVMADQRGHGIGTALDVYTDTTTAQKTEAVERLSNWIQ